MLTPAKYIKSLYSLLHKKIVQLNLTARLQSLAYSKFFAE